jgi:hypothetical protein
LLPVEKFWQAQRQLTRHNCLYLAWSTTQNIQATIVVVFVVVWSTVLADFPETLMIDSW